MLSHKTKHNTGFSIIEVIASMAIITVGLLTLYSVFTIAISISNRNKHITIAYQRMNKSIETSRSLPFASLTNGTSTETVTDLYSGNLTKTISNYNGDSNIKQIVVNVSWSEKGRTETVTASTLATSGGLND